MPLLLCFPLIPLFLFLSLALPPEGRHRKTPLAADSSNPPKLSKSQRRKANRLRKAGLLPNVADIHAGSSSTKTVEEALPPSTPADEGNKTLTGGPSTPTGHNSIHSAGYDAFATGSLFLDILAKFGLEKTVQERNCLHLMGKEVPLVLKPAMPASIELGGGLDSVT